MRWLALFPWRSGLRTSKSHHNQRPRTTRLVLEELEERIQLSSISDTAYLLLHDRVTENQTFTFVYRDGDSGSGIGFPSGFFGVTNKVHLNAAALDDPNSPSGTSTDPTRLDRMRGTVMQVTFDPLSPGQFAGVNIEEPENWGVLQTGTGYDLRSATKVTFDVRSPTPGGVKVQFGVGGRVTPFIHIAQGAAYSAVSFQLSGLVNPATGIVSPPDLANVHIPFAVATNDANAPNGGTVLLDNIRYDASPAGQATVPSFPISNETFGVVPLSSAAPGRIAFPLDQVLRNTATTYESAMALLALLQRGTAADLADARCIADAFVYAQAHDNHGDPLPVAADGSTGFHNAFESGALPLFNGQQPPKLGQRGDDRLAGFSVGGQYFLLLDGATGGNNSFAISALAAAFQQFKDPRYLTAAETTGQWIVGNLSDTTGTGFGGYYLGYPDLGITPKDLQTGKSVENAADIFAAFKVLAAIESGLGHTAQAAAWTSRANVAGDFVMSLFDEATGRFFAGTVPVGTAAGPGIDPTGPQKGNDVINKADFLDAATFTTLALAGSSRYRSLIDWRRTVQYVLTHFAQMITVASGSQTFQGFDLVSQPTAGPNGIAWEFTSQVIVTMRFVDRLYRESRFEPLAQFYLDQVSNAQNSAPFGDGRGVVASTVQDGDVLPPIEQALSTPFQDIPERVGLAATTWAIFADQGASPFPSVDSVVVAQSGGSTAVTEGGATDTYTVVLTSQPAANVTITQTTDSQGSVAPVALTFTPDDWNVPQTVTVSAVDNHVVEGTHTKRISLAASSVDPGYDGITNASVTVTVNDPAAFQLQGNSLTVQGTGQNDDFRFVAGSLFQITLNGVNYTASPSLVQSIVFQGNGGSDIATLTGDTGANALTLRPGSALLSAAGITVSLSGVTRVFGNGRGSSDTATFLDAPGANTFVATASYAYLSGSGFYNQVVGFKNVYATATAGNVDTAYLYSASSSKFVNTATYGYLTGPGYISQVVGFKVVVAYGNADGNDPAYLYAPSGASSLTATPVYNYLTGTGGYLGEAINFKTVTVYAAAGSTSTALLFDSAGIDKYLATPVYASLQGVGFLNMAVGFKSVTAYSSQGSSDTSTLYDAAGSNTFVGTATYAYLTGAGYFIQANGFKTVNVIGSAGTDTATLYDGAGANRFTGQGTTGTLSNSRTTQTLFNFETVVLVASQGSSDDLFTTALAYLLTPFGPWRR